MRKATVFGAGGAGAEAKRIELVPAVDLNTAPRYEIRFRQKMNQTPRAIYPKAIRTLFFAAMCIGVWSSTAGLKGLLEIIRECSTKIDSGSIHGINAWLIAGLVEYLAARVVLEAIVLAIRRIGSGRLLAKDNPQSLLRRVAGWELIGVFAAGICVIMSVHGCRLCSVAGIDPSSCTADILLRVMSMTAAIWVLRCLRVTGVSVAPTKEWM